MNLNFIDEYINKLIGFEFANPTRFTRRRIYLFVTIKLFVEISLLTDSPKSL